MRVLHTFDTPPSRCPYLGDRKWRMRYQILAEISPEECDSVLLDGWFKVGAQLQKPICRSCKACLSMRIPLDDWTPNRAQRRVLEKNAHLEVAFAMPPVADVERVLLHNHYRLMQASDRDWEYQSFHVAGYAEEFVEGPLTMAEITVRDEGRLVAVVLADVGADAVTGVTHYYDPSLREQSIGLFAMLQTFALGVELGKKWAYLGYFVAGSPTMDYKKQFLPCELRGADGIWRRFERGETLPSILP